MTKLEVIFEKDLKEEEKREIAKILIGDYEAAEVSEVIEELETEGHIKRADNDK